MWKRSGRRARALARDGVSAVLAQLAEFVAAFATNTPVFPQRCASICNLTFSNQSPLCTSIKMSGKQQDKSVMGMPVCISSSPSTRGLTRSLSAMPPPAHSNSMARQLHPYARPERVDGTMR